MRNPKPRPIPWRLAAVLVAMAATLAGGHQSLYAEFPDPTGRYTARVTFRTVYALIPAFPGQSGDKPGFVEIFRNGEGSLGRIPVPMLQMAAVEWKPGGAEVRLVGEWDYATQSCFYWDDTGNRRIYVRGHE